MPRQARLDAPGTLHHVMIRGTEGQSIFHEDKDRQNFLSRLSQIAEDTKTRILAWALMDISTSCFCPLVLSTRDDLLRGSS